MMEGGGPTCLRQPFPEILIDLSQLPVFASGFTTCGSVFACPYMLHKPFAGVGGEWSLSVFQAHLHFWLCVCVCQPAGSTCFLVHGYTLQDGKNYILVTESIKWMNQGSTFEEMFELPSRPAAVSCILQCVSVLVTTT